MAKTSDTGLKQLKNGNWSCRIFKKINGVQIDTTCRVDERTGSPLRTKTEARNYREYKIEQLRKEPAEREVQKRQNKTVKFSKIWELYLNGEAKEKAPSTVVKYTSLWENHLKAEFGNKNINGDEAVSVNEINNYLRNLYYDTDLSHAYITGFLRLFYCLYGVAYRSNLISLEMLTQYTKEKKMRICMPPMTDEDEEESKKIETYDQGQISQMADVFKGSDLEPAFLIAIYCGLRESEIFGLMWDDIDFNNKTLTVNKQLIFVEGVLTLSRLKTLAATRTIEMPDNLVKFLLERKKATNREKVNKAYKNRCVEVVEDIRGRETVEIVGGDFVNRKLYNGLGGKLLTTNSLKAYSKKKKNLYGYSLKMHDLRKTHLTFLANSGYPIKALMERAGHRKLETTMRYYIHKDESMKEQERRIINTIVLDDPVITIEIEGRKIEVKKSELDKLKNDQK